MDAIDGNRRYCNKFVELVLKDICLGNIFTCVNNSIFKKNNETVQRFNTIEFNGSVGDAILHPKFINYLKLINGKNDLIENDEDRVNLRLATNAGLHGKDFWTEVGKQFVRYKRKHLIMVALDGTTDKVTHYFLEVEQKALDNARTLIDTGANVRWQFIEFKHNAHSKLKKQRN